jgi:microcystin-dependent protein
MADQLLAGLPPVLDFSGDVVAGGTVTFYETNTTTPVAIWSDIAATIPLANPLTLDSAGRPSNQIFYVGTVAVKEVIKDASGATLYTVDPSPRFSVTAAAASGVTYAPIANNPSINVQDAIDYVSNLPFSTIPTLTGNAGKALYVDGAGTSLGFAETAGIYCAAVGSNVIDLTTGLSLAGKAAGDQLYWIQATLNTGAVTIAVDGGSTAPLVLNNGSAVPSGKLIAGDFHSASYDGTNWVLGAATGIDGTVIGATTPAAGSFTTLTASNLVGQVSYFAANAAPTGWLKANGATISRTTYANLFAAIGTTFGVGDGSTTFGVPDLRGEFLRAWDDARGIDSGRVFGSAQTDIFKTHTHDILRMDVAQAGATTARYQFYEVSTGKPLNPGATQSEGGSETRPRNIAMLACIKF